MRQQLIKTAMEKLARSKLYEIFDYLSEHSQNRILNNIPMRSQETILKGIEKGNKALIKKHNLTVNEVQSNPYYSPSIVNHIAHTAETQLKGAPIKGKGFIMNPYRAEIYIPDINSHNNIVKQFWRSNHRDLRNELPIIKRHEIYEATDPKVKEFKSTGDITPQAVGISVNHNTGEISRPMYHLSLGVLGKERKALEGFSYLPVVQDAHAIREGNRETDLLSHVLNKNIDLAPINKAEIKRLTQMETPDPKSGISIIDPITRDRNYIMNNIPRR
jgi:hypothetical protein